jgi:methylated-DNA-[protein]-cysteine S-methyltransferase
MDTHCEWIQISPFGPLLVETTEVGVRVVTLRSDARSRSDICPDCAEIQAAFDSYFNGDSTALETIPVDLSGARTDFDRTVLRTLHDTVPAGSTTTYGELASASGRPRAARAVGSVMANNPVPIIVPCHRVLASNGSLGGYGGGLDMKRRLLEIEGVKGFRAASNAKARRRNGSGT